MLIEFIKGDCKLSVRCDASANIGHIADYISKWADIIDNLTSRGENEHSALSPVLEDLNHGIPLNLLDLVQRCDNIIQQHQLQIPGQINPIVTLWWARKPLAREQTLSDRFADNGDRIRIAVALGPLDPSAVVEHPVATLSSQPRKATSADDIASKKANQACEKASQVLASLGDTNLPLQSLSSLQPKLSPHIKSLLVNAFLGDDPHVYLDNAMNNNSELREFADQILLALGKTQTPEESNISFTG